MSDLYKQIKKIVGAGNDEYDFTYEDFQRKYGDNPPIGSVSLDDVVKLRQTSRKQRNDSGFGKDLTGQYYLGWDISPIPPMGKEEFLKEMRKPMRPFGHRR